MDTDAPTSTRGIGGKDSNESMLVDIEYSFFRRGPGVWQIGGLFPVGGVYVRVPIRGWGWEGAHFSSRTSAQDL